VPQNGRAQFSVSNYLRKGRRERSCYAQWTPQQRAAN
jgi:hypothetical protein